jgi:hypothetical protein
MRTNKIETDKTNENQIHTHLDLNCHNILVNETGLSIDFSWDISQVSIDIE